MLLIQERGGKCVDCGYDNPLALEFDHRDRATKTKIVGTFSTLASMRAEAYKCDVRCSNCHQIKTWYKDSRRGGLWL